MPPKKTAKKKTKSKVNEAGNYTKPTMRKALFNKIGKSLSEFKTKQSAKWGARLKKLQNLFEFHPSLMVREQAIPAYPSFVVFS